MALAAFAPRVAHMKQLDTEINDFLMHYADTLTNFDSTASANLWAMPGMIVDDQYSGVIDDRETMAQGLEQSYPLYRKLGLASVSHECVDVKDLTDAVKLVQVRWLFHDAEGNQLTDSNAYYIVRQDDDGLHATVCIQIDDAEKIQTLAAERGIDLSQLNQ